MLGEPRITQNDWIANIGNMENYGLDVIPQVELQRRSFMRNLANSITVGQGKKDRRRQRDRVYFKRSEERRTNEA